MSGTLQRNVNGARVKMPGDSSAFPFALSPAAPLLPAFLSAPGKLLTLMEVRVSNVGTAVERLTPADPGSGGIF